MFLLLLNTADESLNSLNVRCQRVQNHARSRDITTQANQVLEGLIASFENLFGHIEVKVNALSLNSDFKGATDDLRQVWNKWIIIKVDDINDHSNGGDYHYDETLHG